MLGYIGLLNLVLLSPAIIAIAALSLDNIKMITGTVFGFILLGGICDQVISDYLWARAVVLTSPTVATVGMSITIPLAFVSDLVLSKPGAGSFLSAVGALLVIFGFLFVNSPDAWWEKCMPFMFLDALRDQSAAEAGEEEENRDRKVGVRVAFANEDEEMDMSSSSPSSLPHHNDSDFDVKASSANSRSTYTRL